MSKRSKLFILLLLALTIYIVLMLKAIKKTKNIDNNSNNSIAILTPIVVTPTSINVTPTPISVITHRVFQDNFDYTQTLQETPNLQSSVNKEWWLNSGAYLYISNNIAKTTNGELPANDPRRIDYLKNNPGETDDGYHPQNIFRLVAKSKWTNYEQTAYFKIDKYILSSDSRRQSSNGLLLFNRYQDGQTLYYTGLRVDGYAVIKKKYKGTYYNMSYLPFIKGEYSRDRNPNLIPLNTWIGIKSKVQNNSDGSVSIKLYIDIGKTGDWKLAAQGVDLNSKYSNTPIISQEGYVGIRTDFMDAEFSGYRIEETNVGS